VERLLIAIGVILAFVILVALLPKKLSLSEVDRPSLAASVSPVDFIRRQCEKKHLLREYHNLHPFNVPA
jgi:hypothetical protein